MTAGPGIRPIRRMLVANRGEIAVRVIDAAHDLGIEAVAVYAEPDRTGLAVAEADAAVALGGTTAAETYLDQARLLEAALTQGCDAVHPGYGFLAERADFARAVVDAGLIWIGPHPDAIAAMGDKLQAKRLAAETGVPSLPSAELTGDAEFEWRAQAAAVGYPLLVKAAAGGGGRGMRLVAAEDELAEAVPSARREAEAAFGDGTVFAERWLAAPRHVEVQVVADRHGNVVHLGERECSIQRRHQKILEEAPSPAVDDELRASIGTTAVALARAIGYDSVGTAEFLLDDTTGQFYFLEMNTRIQVEHRVTEEITGWDLVRRQIRSAQGEPLEADQDDVELDGHAVEVRLYAEDPSRDWLPTFGTVHRWADDEDAPGILVDRAVTDGSEVGTGFDPMLAKVVAYGRDRRAAVGRLIRYLRDLELHGPVTNRDYLVAVLEHPDFLEGRTTTLFVADHPALLDAGPEADVVAHHALVAALARSHKVGPNGVWSFVPAGWRNVGPSHCEQRYTHHRREIAVAWALERDGSVAATVDGVVLSARLLDRLEHDLLVEIDGVARWYGVRSVGTTWFVNSSAGQTDLVEVARFADVAATDVAGGPVAPVPGRVVAVEVAAGDRVERGQTLVVLEAMKVEHQVRAATTALVAEVLVGVGDAVDAHQLLIRTEEVP